MVANKNRIFFILLMITIVAVFSVISITKLDKESKKLDEQYPVLENYNTITGIVMHLFSEHGHIYITLTDSIKYLIAHSINYNYSPYFLDDFIIIGDSLVKHAGSDTLFVYRNKEEYYFLIGESVGVDPTPKIFRQ